MNKSELVETVATGAGVTQRETESVIEAFFDAVRAEAKKGGRVAWPGFGSFSTSRRRARSGTNPQTGAPMKIRPSTTVRFSASSALKEFLNARRATTKKAPATKKATKLA